MTAPWLELEGPGSVRRDVRIVRNVELCYDARQ